jgi:hypothetical protein
MHICEISLTVSEQCYQTHITQQGNVTSFGWVTAVTTSHRFDLSAVREGLMLVVLKILYLIFPVYINICNKIQVSAISECQLQLQSVICLPSSTYSL